MAYTYYSYDNVLSKLAGMQPLILCSGISVTWVLIIIYFELSGLDLLSGLYVMVVNWHC